jgi:hypothetical protein
VTLEWKYSTAAVDWDELCALYRAAPLGDKKPLHLQKVFANSLFKCLYAVPGREPFYRKFGFLRMKTAMAIFENQQEQLQRGYLSEA